MQRYKEMKKSHNLMTQFGVAAALLCHACGGPDASTQTASASLSSDLGARIELDLVGRWAGFSFSATNLSRSAKLTRVELDLGPNAHFDLFPSTSKFKVEPQLLKSNDGNMSRMVSVKFAGKGISGGQTVKTERSNDIDPRPWSLSVAVYFDTGHVLRGMAHDRPDSDDEDPRRFVFEAHMARPVEAHAAEVVVDLIGRHDQFELTLSNRSFDTPISQVVLDLGDDAEFDLLPSTPEFKVSPSLEKNNDGHKSRRATLRFLGRGLRPKHSLTTHRWSDIDGRAPEAIAVEVHFRDGKVLKGKARNMKDTDDGNPARYVFSDRLKPATLVHFSSPPDTAPEPAEEPETQRPEIQEPEAQEPEDKNPEVQEPEPQADPDSLEDPAEDGAGSGFPVVLRNGQATPNAPEKRVVEINVDVPRDMIGATLVLEDVFDADTADEGYMTINNRTSEEDRIHLFDWRADPSAYNNVTRPALRFWTDPSVWRQGSNTIRFVHTREAGFRVGNARVEFVRADGQKKIDGPLAVLGTDFIDSRNRGIQLAGAVLCCSNDDENGKDRGWPFVDIDLLKEMADHKANYAHIRLGPFAREGTEFMAYATKNGVADLSKWNPRFWRRARNIVSAAQKLGIYVEVDLIDAWILERPPLTPWYKDNNQNGVGDHEGTCEIMEHGPNTLHKKWLSKIVNELGSFPNVIYQIGNETFDCNLGNYKGTRYPRAEVQPAWELGIVRFVRSQGGHKGQLLGTNSHRAEIENHSEIDYIVKHMNKLPPKGPKPVMINEYFGAMSPSEIRSKLDGAYERGVTFHIWRGPMLERHYQDALDELMDFHISIGQ